MKHVISVLLENEPGALSRVVGLFSARGYNIETLTVAPTEDATLSRMTIVTTGSDEVIEQITKHLNRLVDVVKVVDLTEGAHIERELMLVKVRAVGKEREEMKRMADIFRGRIIDVTDKSYTCLLYTSSATSPWLGSATVKFQWPVLGVSPSAVPGFPRSDSWSEESALSEQRSPQFYSKKNFCVKPFDVGRFRRFPRLPHWAFFAQNRTCLLYTSRCV